MKKSKIALAALFFMFVSSAPLFADLIELLSNPVAMSKDSIPVREINLKVGFDFNGTCDANEDIAGMDTAQLDTGNNVSFAAEYVRYLYDYVGVGAGISAQIPRWIEDIPGNFGFAPVYVVLKARSWPQEPGMYGYVMAQLGYNFFYGDSDFDGKFSPERGGFYYGIGLGITYKAFLLEGMYSANHGIVEDKTDNNNSIGIDYGKFTVSIGCRL